MNTSSDRPGWTRYWPVAAIAGAVVLVVVVLLIVAAGGDDEQSGSDTTGGAGVTTATDGPNTSGAGTGPTSPSTAPAGTDTVAATDAPASVPGTGATTTAAPGAPGGVDTTVAGEPPTSESTSPPPTQPPATGLGPNPEAPTPPPAPPTEGALALRENGLAEFDFGADPAATTAAMTARFGPPTDETGPDPGPDGCAYTEATTVSFADGTVTLTYADRREDSDPGAPPRPQFVAWRVAPAGEVAPPAVRTFEGTTLGTPVAVLRATYGPRLTVASETPDGAVLVVDQDQPGRALVLETTGNGETDTVQAMAAGSCTV